MSPFTRLWAGRRGGPSRPRLPVRVRPRVESLEDRTLLATRLVVPLSQPADMVNTFHDLNSAVTQPTTVAGDTIQVEPGSTPGVAVVNKQLTLQGDPNAGPPSLPQVGTLMLATNNVVVQNLNLSAVILANGATGLVIRNSTVAAIAQAFGPQVNGGDVITGNVITGTVTLGSNAANPAALADQVLNNGFTNPTAATLLLVGKENGPLVQGNTFTDPANGTTAVEVDDSLGALVSNNVITLAGPASTGIRVGNPRAAASVTVIDNRVDTAGQGVGIATTKAAGTALLAGIANNNLVRDLVGLKMTGDGTANADALGTVDAGGGPLQSFGGNDFHGYTGAGGHFAIVTANAVPTSASVTARGNTFSTATPAAVVQAGAGTIDVSSPLTPEAGFADRLANDFLQRSFNPAPGGELDFWANLASARGARRTALFLLRQPEALSRLVDVLFLKLLGRLADPASEAFWMRALRRGNSLEMVMSAFLASGEFRRRAGTLVPAPADTDRNYITALYIVLMGRVPSSAEVDAWLPRLANLGPRQVALRFVRSTEFRKLFTATLYGGTVPPPPTAFVTGLPVLLNRPVPPADSQLTHRAHSSQQLLDMLNRIAASPEFFSNG
jgi:hypothetical protein